MARTAFSNAWRFCSLLLSALALPFSGQAYEGSALSGNFSVDTRWTPAQGNGASGLFSVDTRFSGSAGDAASGLFTLDTTGAVIGDASITGHVADGNGVSLVSASVAAMQGNVVRALTGTDGSGNYALNGLPAGVYDVRVDIANYLTGIRYGVALSSGGSSAQNFSLAIKPAVPAVVSTTEIPPNPNIVPVSGTQLKVWDGSAFTSGSVDLGKMTVVFTHGWNSNPNVWATHMVAQMIAGGFNNANFLAWDWQDAADEVFPSKALSATPGQGQMLGVRLSQTLGQSYSLPIHFIGHSFGTLVNAKAADFLNGLPVGSFSPAHTHMTLLDEGEIGSLAGPVMAALIPGAGLFQDSFGVGWASPVPKKGFAWLDNYISFLGLPHINKGVDAILGQGVWRVPATSDIFQRVQDLHGYAPTWYARSAADPNSSELGFKQSFERQGTSWVPASSAPQRGTAFRQGITGSELPLVQISAPEEGVALGALWAANGLDMFGVAVLRGGATVAQGIGAGVLLDVVQSIVPKTPSGTPVYSDTAGSTPAYYTSSPAEDVAIHSFQATLQTPSFSGLAKQPGLLNVQPLDGGIDTNPPCIWLPITVPSNAAIFSFDFSFQGDPGEDVLSASISGTNVFALEAKYMPTNQNLNSGPIPIELFAGQNVDLFFGLLGGTASNASVTVNAMRFYSIEPPSVTIAPTSGAFAISWPATATGYVLESGPSLSDFSQWIACTNAPSLLGLQYVVTNVPSDTRFYRLRR